MRSIQAKVINVFKAYPWQVDFWKDTSPILLSSGSAGGGKSRLCAEKLHGLLLKYPNATGLSLRKDRQSMTNSTLLQLEGIMGLSPIKNPDGTYDENFVPVTNIVHKPQKYRFEYDNGSILAYGGMKDDTQRQKIRSVGKEGNVDFCWMEEATAFSEEDFNEILGRMRGTAAPFRQIMLSTNPDAPMHWINVRLINGKEAVCYFSSAADNPANPEDYQENLKKISGVEGLRLREGKWVRAEGVIYDNFDYRKHIRPIDFVSEIMSYKTFVAGADSNFPKPRAGLIGGVNAQSEIHILDEFYEERSHPEQLGQWFNDFGMHYKTFVQSFHDPSDPEAIDKINDYPRVSCDKALNAVIPGISEVYEMFQNGTLIIADRCVNLIRELQTYAWKKGGKEQPVKENDHLCDALRYLVFTFKSRSNVKGKVTRFTGGFI